MILHPHPDKRSIPGTSWWSTATSSIKSRPAIEVTVRTNRTSTSKVNNLSTFPPAVPTSTSSFQPRTLDSLRRIRWASHYHYQLGSLFLVPSHPGHSRTCIKSWKWNLSIKGKKFLRKTKLKSYLMIGWRGLRKRTIDVSIRSLIRKVSPHPLWFAAISDLNLESVKDLKNGPLSREVLCGCPLPTSSPFFRPWSRTCLH